MVDYSTVVVLDEPHRQQLQETWCTWKRIHPEILRVPMIVICDAIELSLEYWQSNLGFLDHPHRELVFWSWPDNEEQLGQISQRERMLTAWVKVPPQVVATDYYLKIDTDVVATGPWPAQKTWTQRSWFRGQPALIARKWGYTKPGSWIDDLQAWAQGVQILAGMPRLDLPPWDPQAGLKYRHQRIASWMCFVRTAFSRVVAGMCPGRLPVPSQDTLHWYCAARLGLGVKFVNFKQHGWQTVHSDRKRRAKVGQVMESISA